MKKKNETLQEKIERIGQEIKSRNSSQMDFISGKDKVTIDFPKNKQRKIKKKIEPNEKQQQLDINSARPSGHDEFLETKKTLKDAVKKSVSDIEKREVERKKEKKQKCDDKLKKLSSVVTKISRNKY